jgi:ubiquitin carboxyl-terminal hydrolase 9/24
VQVPELDKEDSVFAQLQGLFAQLAISKATFAGPARFWAAFKDYDGTPIDVREHQDAYEFFTRLQVRAVRQ